MEFEEHEEQDEELPNYDDNSSRPRMGSGGAGERKIGGGGGGYRYRECLKNHAVNIGGHALDGCGEFMAAGDEGTLESLKCAACNCHRNFHRKELLTPAPYYQHHHHRQPAGYLHMTPPPLATSGHQRPLALPSTSREDQEDMSNPSSSGGGGSGSKKRFRTKFTAEQKDKMLGFAESIGWRIQKTEEAAVQQFCAETGVKRQVLKVWMHNNKHTLGQINMNWERKKDSAGVEMRRMCGRLESLGDSGGCWRKGGICTKLSETKY